MSAILQHRYLLARRFVQLGTLALLYLGAHQGSRILQGNLTSSRLFGAVPLSDPFALLQVLATGHLPGTTALVGGLIVLGAYWLMGGRTFCSWVCPVNMISDGAGWLKRRFTITGQLTLTPDLRYWILAVAVVLSAITGVAAFEWLSPIGMVHRELIFTAGAGLLVIPLLLVLDLWVVRRGWCGSLCPLGAFWSLVGRASPVVVRFDRDACDECGACLLVCPEKQVLKLPAMASAGFVDAGACTRCARCVETCPTFALQPGLRPLRAPDSSSTERRHAN